MPSPAEQADLDKLHAECAAFREQGFYAMREALAMDSVMLKASGYKTKEEALVRLFRYYQGKIVKRVAEHLKKYPD